MEFESKRCPGLTTAGILNEFQKMVFQRTSKAGWSSCQCSTTLYGMRKEMKNYVKIIQNELKNTLEDFIAVIGLPLDLVQKRSGTPHIANQTDLGTRQQRRWCKISKDLVTQHSVYQCLLGRGHLRSKGGGRTTIHPQQAMITTSCSSKRSSPSISSVFTEQWRISFKHYPLIKELQGNLLH